MDLQGNLKTRLQRDLQKAMIVQDKPRVSVLRILLDEFDGAQKTLGKTAYENSLSENVLPETDRQQVLDEETVAYILRKELLRRREYIDMLIRGGQKEKVESEQVEIAILEKFISELRP